MSKSREQNIEPQRARGLVQFSATPASEPKTVQAENLDLTPSFRIDTLHAHGHST